MQNFTAKIVNMMKSESLYASQGGPIILSQIENEYQNIEAAFTDKGPSYVRWAATMAVGLQTDVPWVMCKQSDAPDPVMNTCNGMKCGFQGPNSPNKPSMWTENWTSFYQVFGGEPYIRSAEDIAFHVTLFIAKNGSYVNYYMFHGGTNSGRTGAAYVTRSYYDQAPLDEYGLIRQPKWGHLKQLHAAMKSCSMTLLQGVRTNFSLGQLQEAYIFQEGSGGCVAFLVNNNGRDSATVQFHNVSFELLPKSISILPDCQNVIFNTATVKTESNERTTTSSEMFDSMEKWEEFKDVIPNFLDMSIKSFTLLEHMNMTKDESDYLWYTFRFQQNLNCTKPLLHIESLGHIVHAFANKMYFGAAHGSHDVKGFTFENSILLNNDITNISILSVMVGLPVISVDNFFPTIYAILNFFPVSTKRNCFDNYMKDSGPFLENRFAGLTNVEIQCSEGIAYNFTDKEFGYQVGLLGEKLQIYNEQNLSNVDWSKTKISTNQPVTWYKAIFDAPIGGDSVALNPSTMGKGEAWINGQSIGRYWISFRTSKGIPSQTLYHVPRSFMKPSGILLVLFEEVGGDPLHISLDTILVNVVHIHDGHLSQ